MEGIEVDDSIKDIIRGLKNFKQGALLENSLVRTQHRLSQIEYENAEFDIESLVKSQMTNQLAKHILNQHKDSIKSIDSDELPGQRTYSLELFVMTPENLKHIVEFCIRQIPEEALSKIRKN